MSDFLNRMKAAAKADVKTIVLPEGEDPRTIEAAKKIIEEGIASVVILGNPAEIDVPGAHVIDPTSPTAPKHEAYAQKFAELRARRRHHRAGARPDDGRHLLWHHDGQDG